KGGRNLIEVGGGIGAPHPAPIEAQNTERNRFATHPMSPHVSLTIGQTHDCEFAINLISIIMIRSNCNFAIDCVAAMGTAMPEELFDSDAFYAALNATRLSRQKTWKDVAEESGVTASTLTRIGQGAKPDVNGLAALLAWSNLKLETFIRRRKSKPSEPIAE